MNKEIPKSIILKLYKKVMEVAMKLPWNNLSVKIALPLSILIMIEFVLIFCFFVGSLFFERSLLSTYLSD